MIESMENPASGSDSIDMSCGSADLLLGVAAGSKGIPSGGVSGAVGSAGPRVDGFRAA